MYLKLEDTVERKVFRSTHLVRIGLRTFCEINILVHGGCVQIGTHVAKFCGKKHYS